VRVLETRVIFASNECVICSADVADIESRKELFVCRARVCGLELNANLNVIVVATEDSFLNVHSFSSGELTGTVFLKGAEPDRFLVTPFWGFLVVLVDLEIFIYTINGEEVGVVKVDTEIREWVCYADQNGFDFVVFVDVANRIGVFEVGEPKEIKFVAGKYTNALTLRYMEEKKCIAGVVEEGLLALYPLP
jgi:hypothetical protein